MYAGRSVVVVVVLESTIGERRVVQEGANVAVGRTQDAGSNRTTTSTSFNERQSLCREDGGP